MDNYFSHLCEKNAEKYFKRISVWGHGSWFQEFVCLVGKVEGSSHQPVGPRAYCTGQWVAEEAENGTGGSRD